MSRTKVLCTGGCGFLGHHLIEHIIKQTDWDIVVIDKLSYASSGFDRLRDISVFDDKRIQIFSADFSQPISHGVSKEIGQVDYIIHLGAETHVDRSIEDPEPFVMANVVGTMRMLDFARTQKELKWFVYFSTDEVFGPAPEGVFYKEWDRYNTTNPYAATKAGGEELALSYANTYNIPLFITHTMNLYGERQDKEKFIPLVINKVMKGEEVTIHSDKTQTQSGSRHWIHARNVSEALLFLLGKAKQRDKYNIVGEERTNLEIAEFIAKTIGKKLNYTMVDFHSSRPGHDLRYALNGTKLKDMGFKYPKTLEESLKKTITWSLANTRWLQ